MVQPSESVEVNVSYEASDIYDDGVVTVELPLELDFSGSWVDRSGFPTVQSVAFDGKVATVQVSGNPSRGKIALIANSIPLDELPDNAQEFDIGVTFIANHPTDGMAENSRDFVFKMHYAQIEVFSDLSGSAGPGDVISYSVVVSGYGFGVLENSTLNLPAPLGTDIILGSVTGEAGATVTEDSGRILLEWGEGVASKRTVSYNVKVRELFQIPDSQTEIVNDNVFFRMNHRDTRINENDLELTYRRSFTITGGSSPLTLDRLAIQAIVNSFEDRPRDPDSEGCDTGEITPQGLPECTLRSAIEAVNAGLTSRITFELPSAVVPELVLESPLPPILAPVVIDGTTQPTAQKVKIVGGGMSANGLDLRGGSSEIRGLVMSGFETVFDDPDETPNAAISISGPGSNKIVGNWLGTAPDGNAAEANVICVVVDGSSQNTIGGETEADRNIIFGSTGGVVIRGDGADSNHVVGNSIGLGANGELLGEVEFGVVVQRGNSNRIGGAGDLGNSIVAAGAVFASGKDSMSALTIEGNRIGLDGAGTTKPAIIESERSAISISPLEDALYTSFEVRDNYMAGHAFGIFLTGLNLQGPVVSGNIIGLTFDGSDSIPVGVERYDQNFGIRIDGAPDAQITGNTIAGHQRNIIISGQEQFEEVDGLFTYANPSEPLDLPDAPAASGIVVQNNAIGVYERLESAGEAAQWNGVLIFSKASDTTISGNTIAGHNDDTFDQIYSEISLRNVSEQTVTGNVLGTSDGTNQDSQIGVEIVDGSDIVVSNNLIGHNAIAGIRAEGSTSELVIGNNTIGTNAGFTETWTNGRGILIQAEGGASPSDVRINDNVVANSETIGINLISASDVEVDGNFVGTGSVDGPELSNATGIKIEDSSSQLTDNTIAFNTIKGVSISGLEAVSIESCSIYENGSGARQDGIDYVTPPVETPRGIGILRTAPADGKPGFVRVFVPAIGGEGNVTLEIFGNERAESPQGQVPLLRRTIGADEIFTLEQEAGSSSDFMKYASYSVTATVGSSTSEFSSVSRIFDFPIDPVIKFVPSSRSDEFRIAWFPAEIFKLVESSTPTGPAADIFNEPTFETVGGVLVATAVIPVSPRPERFFRLAVDWERILSGSDL